MDDVEEEQHILLGFECGDRPSFYPLCELVYDDKEVGVSFRCLLERSNQIEPPDHEGPCDGDHLECLGQEVSLPSIVLTPFAGVHDLLGVGYYSGLIEALSKCVSDLGSRRGMVTAYPIMDIALQTLPLFDGDAALQDPGVASLVEFTLHKNKRTWHNIRAVEPPSCPSVAHHRGGSRGRASSSRPEGRALLLGSLQAP